MWKLVNHVLLNYTAVLKITPQEFPDLASGLLPNEQSNKKLKGKMSVNWTNTAATTLGNSCQGVWNKMRNMTAHDGVSVGTGFLSINACKLALWLYKDLTRIILKRFHQDIIRRCTVLVICSVLAMTTCLRRSFWSSAAWMSTCRTRTCGRLFMWPVPVTTQMWCCCCCWWEAYKQILGCASFGEGTDRFIPNNNHSHMNTHGHIYWLWFEFAVDLCNSKRVGYKSD